MVQSTIFSSSFCILSKGISLIIGEVFCSDFERVQYQRIHPQKVTRSSETSLHSRAFYYYYCQTDTMSLSLGPTLATFFLMYHDEKLLKSLGYNLNPNLSEGI